MKALLIIDMQNDFMPGGSLPVPQGDKLIPLINDLMKYFPLIVASQDCHPADHVSFAKNHPGRYEGEVIEVKGEPQVLWPMHCVVGTHGAEFVSNLNSGSIDAVFPKGQSKELDSYSAFFDNAHLQSTGLADFLKERGVTDVYLTGVATDYCVLYSALDALELGFNVYLIAEASSGVDLQEGASQRAGELIESKGGHVILSSEIYS